VQIRSFSSVLLLIAFGVFGLAGPLQLSQASRPVVGSPAPNFQLKTAAGEAVELAAMKSKGPVVLLMLRGFPGYQCPYCTAQVGEFMARIKDFQAAGANIIAVYPGPAEGLIEHAQDFVRGKTVPSNFYLVVDPDYSFTNMYGLRWDAPSETAYPATFLVDKTGIVRFAKVSNSHGDRAGADSVLQVLRRIP
jgi:thioredoxin-dependent peroxiredoxin